MFSRYKEQYDQLWKLFIRPPRNTYALTDLGPLLQTINNTTVRRYDFDIKNKNNFVLKCSFFQLLDKKTSQPSSDICVIYLHGNAGSRLEGLNVMPFAIESGMNFCCFDFAGCGLSEGEYISLGIHEKDDVILLKQNLKSKFGIKEIACWGRSMGAVAALHVGAKENDFFTIICDSPFAKLNRLATEFAKENKHYSIIFTSIMLSFVKKSIKKRAHFTIDSVDQTLLINQCKMPILFVTSKEDKFIKSYNVEELYNLYKGNKKLCYEKGDHNATRSIEFYKEGMKFISDNLLVKIVPEIQGKNKIMSNSEERKSIENGKNNNKKAVTQTDIIKKFSIINQKFDNHLGGKAFPLQNNYYPPTQI